MALSLIGSAGAHIVPGACIGGIGIWDSSTEVRRQWGPPIHRTWPQAGVRWHYRLSWVYMTRWGYEPDPTKVIVLGIKTTDPRERTRSGVGVGSSVSEVLAGVGLLCPRNGQCDLPAGGSVRIPDYRLTTFTFRNGRVVSVAVWINSSYDDGGLQQPDPRCRPNK
jgi:hypothetical protein